MFWEHFIPEPPRLLWWTLHFPAVDVVDDIMRGAAVNGAADGLGGSQDLLDGSWGETEPWVQQNRTQSG